MENDKKILEAVQEAARNGRLTCTQARRLAEDFQVPPARIGAVCNQLKIKIKACELGCF